jgi:DNA-directed RNA polymerase specialized sigma subunit
MKITLNMGKDQGGPNPGAALKNVLDGVRTGDWKFKQQLAKMFIPLITTMAEKRAKDIPAINALIEAGTNGLHEAAEKFGKNEPPEKFQLFALTFIEKHMDGGNKPEGFLARLFKR